MIDLKAIRAAEAARCAGLLNEGRTEMTDDQITELAIQAGSSVCMGIQRAFTLKQLQAFAQLVRNAALFEAMEVCIDQGELKDHDAMDCYYAIQRLKS